MHLDEVNEDSMFQSPIGIIHMNLWYFRVLELFMHHHKFNSENGDGGAVWM